LFASLVAGLQWWAGRQGASATPTLTENVTEQAVTELPGEPLLSSSATRSFGDEVEPTTGVDNAQPKATQAP